jgi:hypothetical protein
VRGRNRRENQECVREWGKERARKWRERDREGEKERDIILSDVAESESRMS